MLRASLDMWRNTQAHTGSSSKADANTVAIDWLNHPRWVASAASLSEMTWSSGVAIQTRPRTLSLGFGIGG
ncbi:MAG: hypothetical protein Q8P67_20195 [archaeon]|nr:hypothetical protein [archaeon]